MSSVAEVKRRGRGFVEDEVRSGSVESVSSYQAQYLTIRGKAHKE